MNDDYEEEARAFRGGLQQAADNEEFEALDPANLKPAAGRRINWPAVSAVAVVVAAVSLVGVLGTMAGSGMSGGMAASAAGAQAEEPAAAEPASDRTQDKQPVGGAAPEAAPDPGTTVMSGASRDMGEPMAGFRWETFRRVAVQVPETWGHGMIPTSAWCITENWPTEPYVSLQADMEAVPAIGCNGTVPADRLVWHLRLADAASSIGLQDLPAPWRYDILELDGVLVAVASDGSDPELVARILDSAQVLP